MALVVQRSAEGPLEGSAGRGPAPDWGKAHWNTASEVVAGVKREVPRSPPARRKERENENRERSTAVRAGVEWNWNHHIRQRQHLGPFQEEERGTRGIPVMVVPVCRTSHRSIESETACLPSRSRGGKRKRARPTNCERAPSFCGARLSLGPAEARAIFLAL